jgi:hypothetical protein
VARHHLRLSFADVFGEPVESAEVAARVEMPLHGHASNERVEIIEAGGGQYDAFPVTFTMPGRWQVVVDVETDELTSRRTFVYEVQ